MRPRFLLVGFLILLAACGGSTPPADPTTPVTSASPSPTEDPLEAARHSTCLDFKRARNPLASSSDIGDELADALQELANELRIDAGLYAAAGNAKVSAKLETMASDAEAFQPGLREEADAATAISAYSEFVDGLLDRFKPLTCDAEL